MPLIKSTTKAATKANFHELRHGKTFAHTAGKFGKKKAEKQMVAIVLNNKRSAPRKKG